jgi:hypothetical protein
VVEPPMDDVLLAATAKCIADARVSPEAARASPHFSTSAHRPGLPKK